MEKKYILVDGQLCPLDLNSMSVFDKNNAGLVPAPNSDEEMYLKSDGTWKKISAGSGTGTTDYDVLSNKPKINNVELSGNKTLADLGIYEKPTGGIPASDLESGVIPTIVNMTGATSTTDGASGYVPAPNKDDVDKYLKGDGTWSAVASGTTPVEMTGATSTNDGSAGYVPAPTKDDTSKFLKGDGTWAEIPSSGDSSEVKIVTWADGTWEEIGAMLDAHYAGKINIADYWNVGDKKIDIFIEGTKGLISSENTEPKNISLTIVGINHDTLATNNKNAAITVMASGSGIKGIMNSSIANSDDTSWKNSERRKWLKEFKTSLPIDLSRLIQPINKIGYYNNSDYEEFIDYCFLPSINEICGFGAYDITLFGSGKQITIFPQDEGYQYEYFLNQTSFTPALRTSVWDSTNKKAYFVFNISWDENKIYRASLANNNIFLFFPFFCL